MMASKMMPPIRPTDSRTRRRCSCCLNVSGHSECCTDAGHDRAKQYGGACGREPAEEAAAELHSAEGLFLAVHDVSPVADNGGVVGFGREPELQKWPSLQVVSAEVAGASEVVGAEVAGASEVVGVPEVPRASEVVVSVTGRSPTSFWPGLSCGGLSG